MTRWKPALRMARRDLWTHKGRSLLMMVLVALPVLVAVTVAQFHHNTQWEGEQAARSAMGGADAALEVTPYENVEVTYWPSEMAWVPLTRSGDVLGERLAEGKLPKPQRDVSEVDVLALLPPGSRIIDDRFYGSVSLDTGGIGYVKVIDASDPMAEGLGDVSAGVAPTAADEVAISVSAAKALDLVDDNGEPRRDATLGLLDGAELDVVGLMDPRGGGSYPGGIELLAAPGSIVGARASASEFADDSTPARYLVDLPDSSPKALRQLADSLAANGVAVMPRDVMFHPRAWNVQGGPGSPVDVTVLAIGALVVLFGLIEVVLLVGSAFAVGARRQIRDLGLVAANGGAAGDVRTVLLAQGMVLGVVASLLGAAAGLFVFRLGVPLYESVAYTRVWTQDIDWLAVSGLALLGSTTGVIAALVPAWSISRMSPVDALSGQFAVTEKELRTHRPAVALALLGLAVVLASGWWTAHEFADREPISQSDLVYEVPPSPVPVVIGAIGLLLLIGGVTWVAPHVVRGIAGASKFLSVSGRLALREATRHRFRTAASAVTLMITVAGMVFAGFAVQAASAQVVHDAGDVGPRSMTVYLNANDTDPARGEQRLDTVVDAINKQLGDARTLVSYRATISADPYSEPYLGSRAVPGGAVRIVDRKTLAQLVRVDDAVLSIFDTGGVVTTSADTVDDGRARITLDAPGKKYDGSWQLPAVAAVPTEFSGGVDLAGAWMTAEAATRLGFGLTPSTINVLAERDITPADIDALGVQGIEVSSTAPELERVGMFRYAVIGAAALLTLLVVGIAVALSSAEGKADQATMSAIGAGPGRRRLIGAMHGMFIGLIGALLGTLIGLPAGASLMQVDGIPGTAIPWLVLLGLPLVPLSAWVAGWIATSTNLTLVRRNS